MLIQFKWLHVYFCNKGFMFINRNEYLQVKYSTLWLINLVFFVGTFLRNHFAIVYSSFDGFSTSSGVPPGPVYSCN